MNARIRHKNYLMEGFGILLSPTNKTTRNYPGGVIRKPMIRLKTFSDDVAKLRGDWEKVSLDLKKATEKYKTECNQNE